MQERNLEELTKLLTPIIEDTVKRHIETIAQRISEKFQYCTSTSTTENRELEGKASLKSNFNSNQLDNVDNEVMGVHTNVPSPVNQKRTRPTEAGLEEELRQILQSWDVETETETTDQQSIFRKLGSGPTTLQDYHIGEWKIL